ncbi:hypothetical protein P12x_005498 [Tundrisphaera lichenicola]|uniref:hypothetical protein n=1 Tax=Tundrisphaera lichenicola TaxID=2029860 RepID=UPI003EB87BE8
MAEESVSDLLQAAGRSTTEASPEFLAWLGEKKVPGEIIALFAGCVADRQERRPRVHEICDLYTEEEIQKEAAESPRYLKAGLLAIGSGVLGDPVAIDLRKQVGSVGYISHDDVWGDDEAKIRKFFVVIAPSLAELVRRSRDGVLPKDYHQAKKKK